MKSTFITAIMLTVFSIGIGISFAKKNIPDYEFDKQARTKAGEAFEKTITPELVAKGKPLYDKHCSNCHGLQGEKIYAPNERPIAGKTPAKMYGYMLKFKAMANSGKTYPVLVQSMVTPMIPLNDTDMRAIAAYTTLFKK